jgi:hypothetical protein
MKNNKPIYATRLTLYRYTISGDFCPIRVEFSLPDKLSSRYLEHSTHGEITRIPIFYLKKSFGKSCADPKPSPD